MLSRGHAGGGVHAGAHIDLAVPEGDVDAGTVEQVLATQRSKRAIIAFTYFAIIDGIITNSLLQGEIELTEVNTLSVIELSASPQFGLVSGTCDPSSLTFAECTHVCFSPPVHRCERNNMRRS